MNAKVVLLVILLLFSMNVMPQPNRSISNLSVIWDENSKFGYIDENGRVTIKPQYDRALPFFEGKAVVCRDNQCGFINEAGEVVIPLKFHYAKSFSDGVAAVAIKNGDSRPCGYIDHAGKFVIEPQTEYRCSDFKEGFAKIEETGGDYLRAYFINKEGRGVIGGSYITANDFSEGFALVNMPTVYPYSRSEFIDTKNRKMDLEGLSEIFGKEYEADSSFSEGLASIGLRSDRGGTNFESYAFINKSGKIVFTLPKNMKVEGKFKNGLALVSVEKRYKEKVKLGNETIVQEYDIKSYGYINQRGKLSIPAEFKDAIDFHGRLAVVKVGFFYSKEEKDLGGSSEDKGYWKIINHIGKAVITSCGEPLSYFEARDNYSEFGEGFGKGFVNFLYFSKLPTKKGKPQVYGYMNGKAKYVWLSPNAKEDLDLDLVKKQLLERISVK